VIPIAVLTVPGEPIAKARPRHTRGGHSYTPKGTVAFEAAVAAAWDSEDRPDLPACVRLDVSFYLGTHRRVDVDNLVKSIADGLNTRAYDDDWRVHELRAQKFYTTRDRARTEIHVYAIAADREERV
jgi:crossover junction endodeoxyribonuclease RusA